MHDRLSVAIDGPEVADEPGTYEATEPFLLGIDNQGRATHVHVVVDGALETTDGAPDANHFVDSGDSLELLVDVAPAPAEGTITIATGHGADETTVQVTIVEADERPVATGNRQEASPFPVQENLVLVIATAVLALLLAAAAVLFIGDAIVTLGALVVIAATAVGVGYLLTQ